MHAAKGQHALNMANAATGCILIAMLLLAGAAWLLSAPSKTDACVGAPNSRLCFSNETGAISTEKGISEGLAFVRDVVAVQADYPTVHMSMHRVGREAYLQASDIGQALAYLPPPAVILDDFFLYNGFQHGAFEAFFVANGGERPDKLVELACASYTVDDAPLEESILADECLHATGHALMSFSGNDVRSALLLCDTLRAPWMQGWCAHGVFMEMYYLMDSAQPGDPPSPDVREGSILELCKTVQAKYKVSCSQFIGWSYLATHVSDFKGAFAECATLPQADARICIARSSRLFITKTYGSDFAKMRETCEFAGTYEKECLYGAAIGIHEGAAGGALRNADFCTTLDQSLHQGCRDAVVHSRDSLARMYVTEL